MREMTQRENVLRIALAVSALFVGAVQAHDAFA
jgi:hypothetical protein